MRFQDVRRGLWGMGNQLSMDLAQVLFEAVLTLPDPATILEIGPYQGFSTCAMGYGCIGTKRHIWTIDTFIGREENTNIQDGPSYFNTFQANVAHCGLQEYITPMVGRSEEFYATWNRPLDLLFVDGYHPIMLQDFSAFFPHLKQGGMLYMHDVGPTHGDWQDICAYLNGVEYKEVLGWGRKR